MSTEIGPTKGIDCLAFPARICSFCEKLFDGRSVSLLGRLN